MLEESARVVAVSGDRLWVETESRSACSHCTSSGCTTSVVSKLFGVKRNRLELQNSLGVRPGEQVVVGIPDALLVRASIWAYLVPLAVMLLPTLAGDLSGMGEGLQSLLALVGLATGFLLVHWMTRRVSYRQGFRPRLLRIVAQGTVRVEMPNHERSQP
jgi:sigma-E factor negative regulatory protein RseC